ncbi:hypothetical protein [Lysinibacillus sp. 54212]|uniref:hypothetical protein n=1 Tax=Lysinibacillus sp. 54212 TaxID=3119829 RepID=UPI002FCB38B8
MKRFLGLLQKEWHLYRVWIFISIVLGLAVIIGLPPLEDHYFKTALTIEGLRFGLMIVILLVGSMNAIAQFFVSLRADIKVKEIWLHSSSSIYFLVGVKLLFTISWVVIFSFVFAGIGIYNVPSILIGTASELLLLQCFITLITTLVFLSMNVTCILFYAFYLFLKRYIGRVAIVIVTIAFFLSFWLCFKFIETPIYASLFYHGEISLDALFRYFPNLTNKEISLEWNRYYIVEDIFMWAQIIVMYVVGTKWLEKVITA